MGNSYISVPHSLSLSNRKMDTSPGNASSSSSSASVPPADSAVAGERTSNSSSAAEHSGLTFEHLYYGSEPIHGASVGGAVQIKLPSSAYRYDRVPSNVSIVDGHLATISPPPETFVNTPDIQTGISRESKFPHSSSRSPLSRVPAAPHESAEEHTRASWDKIRQLLVDAAARSRSPSLLAQLPRVAETLSVLGISPEAVVAAGRGRSGSLPGSPQGGAAQAFETALTADRVHIARHKIMETEIEAVVLLLSTTSPFHYLPERDIRSLARHCLREVYEEGDIIQVTPVSWDGKTGSDAYCSVDGGCRFCIVESGSVIVCLRTDTLEKRLMQGQSLSRTHRRVQLMHLQEDMSAGLVRFVTLLDQNVAFGEAEMLLGESVAEFIAAKPRVTLICLPEDRFIHVVRSNAAVRTTLASNLRINQNIFDDVIKFRKLCGRAVHEGIVDLDNAVELFKRIKPCIHRFGDSSKIDVSAWAYALNRLPANILNTYVYFASRSLNSHIASVAKVAKLVETKARRRTCFEVRPGNSVILVRDVETDLVDFVSCLAVHIIESIKLRKRLSDPRWIQLLHAVEVVDESEILAKLPLDSETVAGLSDLFRGRVVKCIADIVAHHENYRIPVEIPHATDMNIATSELWSLSLKEAVLHSMNLHELDELDEVHLISSNMHSIVNCLSPFIRQQRERILSWGRTSCGMFFDEVTQGVLSETDLLYVLASRYASVDPAFAAEKLAVEEANGMFTMTRTEFTGIQVNLVDLGRVLNSGITMLDPLLKWPEAVLNAGAISLAGRKVLIVNIDYCFGAQALDIMSALVRLFGRKIRSASVVGKAGGIEGERGDISVATELIMHGTDELLRFPRTFLDVSYLKTITQRTVRIGRMLTVYGTLMQNDPCLLYYRNLWQCIGLEMEGFFYSRALSDARLVGLVEEIPVSFVYYTSDVPMEKGASLSRQLSPAEGVPPLYAISRCVLMAVLDAVSKGLPAQS